MGTPCPLGKSDRGIPEQGLKAWPTFQICGLRLSTPLPDGAPKAAQLFMHGKGAECILTARRRDVTGLRGRNLKLALHTVERGKGRRSNFRLGIELHCETKQFGLETRFPTCKSTVVKQKELQQAGAKIQRRAVHRDPVKARPTKSPGRKAGAVAWGTQDGLPLLRQSEGQAWT